VNINREFQLPWDEAKALFEWGNMEAGRKKKGEAAAKFDQSEEIFRKIGAKWDVEKSRAAKNDLGSSWISRLRK
jgi:hypothetical protein